MSVRILTGDCREVLPTLADESVHCVVTSPPYWGLRDYGTAEWEGGDAGCNHVPSAEKLERNFGRESGSTLRGTTDHQKHAAIARSRCKCGARRIDNQIGLEPTYTEYVETMVGVFREVRRVLRKDGTVWLNLGDSYAGGGRGGNPEESHYRKQATNAGSVTGLTKNKWPHDGFKPKDLCGIPWRVAFALQQPYAVPTCVKSDVDRAWLAAIMDGEGCIGIRRFDSYREEKQQAYQDGFVVYTVVTNNDVPILDRCIDITGYGKVGLKQAADTTDNRGIVSRRDSYGWRLDGNKAVDVIRATYPFLVAKRKQACIAYTLDQLNKRGHGSRSVPPEVQEKKVFLKDLINRCNQRENVEPPSWIEEPKQEIQPGWYLRQDIIWSKPNPMPESVRDRCTKAHEYIFLLSKSERYYFDQDAIMESVTASTVERLSQPTLDQQEGSWRVPGKTNGPMKAVLPKRSGNKQRKPAGLRGVPNASCEDPNGGVAGSIPWEGLQRNKRSVWEVTTQPFSEAHFATFPPALIEPCILAGCPRDVCTKCGAPWIIKGNRPINSLGDDGNGYRLVPSCFCNTHARRGVVLDPFFGAGTTGLVADRLQRDCIGIELNPAYVDMATRRVVGDAPLFVEAHDR